MAAKADTMAAVVLGMAVLAADTEEAAEAAAVVDTDREQEEADTEA